MHDTTDAPIDERIDAALEPSITVQDEGHGIRTHLANVSRSPELYVIREEQDTPRGVQRTPWTVNMPDPGLWNAEGDFTSPAAARNLATALIYAAQVADRLQEAGR